jgi:drug/metabolite transporter (DMT)-like permease
MTVRQTGVWLVVISAIVFSTAGVFTNGVETSAWDVIFWRGAAASLFTLAYLTMRGALAREVRQFGWPALIATCMLAAGTAAFIPAFKLSSVANVALIYGAAPFIAAALSWVALREAPSRFVTIASIVAFGGVLLIVAGSVGRSAWRGDLLALFMTCMMAGSMVLYRAFPATTAALPAALSSVVLLPFAFMLGNPLAVPSQELPVLIAFGAVFALASVTLSEGARRLPSAETALLSILEMPLAPILAFLVLGEIPRGSAVAGGALILVAVVWSQVSEARSGRLY